MKASTFFYTLTLTCFFFIPKKSIGYNKDIFKKTEKKLTYPSHWGAPPKRQTRDRVRLPIPYQNRYGSSTLKKWILKNQKSDKEKNEFLRFFP